MFILGKSLEVKSRLIVRGWWGTVQAVWGVMPNRYGISFGGFKIVLKLMVMVRKLSE